MFSLEFFKRLHNTFLQIISLETSFETNKNKTHTALLRFPMLIFHFVLHSIAIIAVFKLELQ